MERITHDVDGLVKGGAYSHVAEAGGFLFVSGMLPIDVARNIKVTADIREATRLVLENVRRALQSTGSELERVVKVTVFLRDMKDFDDMNQVYRTFFRAGLPARSCVAVKEIPGGFPVEIEVIAAR